MILNEVMKETADAIREKTDKSELIKPVDFAEEIKGITAGGSGESGSSNVEYLDLSPIPEDSPAKTGFLMFSILAKYSTEYGTVIMSPFMTQNINIEKQFKAVMMDFTLQICEMGIIGTVKDALIAQGFTQEDLDAFPRLTKEEFYDLNA